ncbi:MarR family transcriptional regulator [Undibacterium sp. TS12]|uniref:MarR family winged helix-turn-helix transcriptional regulator n=1 Tax=Undibacterium sp. TS12 TaxID=2908202 RepID=UPI001F4C7747|nr:MarR family transcriptional regulator [Undibacterium sp. TS12]MCH8621176.1 winged helix DNA-binding protein [Undibacterium sp. TS12]
MNTFDIIYRIQSAYPRIYHACHADHQPSPDKAVAISQRDATILAHLSTSRPMTQAQLARHLGITKSTMSEAIKYLSGLELIDAQLSSDKRVRLLRLTAQGQDIMSRSSVLEADKLAALLAEMSAAEINKALAGLEILAQACFRLVDKRKDAE